jgi:hypothetical protein
MTDWQEFFRVEDEIRRCAERAGIPKARAAQLATQLACRPLPVTTAARLLVAASRSPCTDPTVVAAHKLLSTLEPDCCPSLTRVRVKSLSDNRAAECSPSGWVFIDPGSKFYRAAQSGELLGLAMLLHHERWHAINGGDEPRALEASIRFLERHHAPQDLIDDERRHLAVHTQGV